MMTKNLHLGGGLPAPSRLAGEGDSADEGETGGLEQQRHPGLPEQPERKSEVIESELAELAAEDDIAADQHAMDQARGLGSLARGYGLNESGEHDLVPGF